MQWRFWWIGTLAVAGLLCLPAARADDPQIPGGMLWADTAGTSAYPGVPVIVNGTNKLTLLKTAKLHGRTASPELPFWHFLFDADGNLYYLEGIGGRLISVAPDLPTDANGDLIFRWVGHDDFGDVFVEENFTNTVIVGTSAVYVSGRAGINWIVLFAFDRADGHLLWRTELSSPPSWEDGRRPHVTLYDNVLYVVGSPDVEIVGKCRVYMLNATTGVQFADGLVDIEYPGWLVWNEGANAPGNVVIVPNAFGPGEHGLYWTQFSEWWPDGRADTVAVRVNPTTGTIANAWGPGSGIDGPRTDWSAVMYSAARDRLYTLSDWWFDPDPKSLYVWDPNAVNGAQLLATATGGSHWMPNCAVLDDFTPGVTKIHAAGDWDQIWTYVDDGVNPIAVEVRNYGIGEALFEPAGLLVNDGTRSVMYTCRENLWWFDPRPPSPIYALDLTNPPGGGAGTILETFNPMYDYFQWPQYSNPWMGLGPDGTIYYLQVGDAPPGWRECRLARLGVADNPTGACCLADGTCLEVTEEACVAAGGLFTENGVACSDLMACPANLGACYFGPDPCRCLDGMSEELCVSQGGLYLGDGTTCDPNPCDLSGYYLDTATGWQGGTGWNGEWITYPSGWINQWWYNDFDLNRQKVITVRFWIFRADAVPRVAVNYTTPNWTNPDNPPLANQEAFIERILVDPPVTGPGYYEFLAVVPYCPQWVSVDVMNTGGDFGIRGEIEHECLLPGACCLPTGCVELLAPVCVAQGGAPAWEGSTCNDIVCPPNDLCANAIDVGPLPASTASSTIYATKSEPAPPCPGNGPPDAPDVWYTVTGTGATITVETCMSPVWDMQIAVFCEDCGNLTCVGGSDEGCDWWGPSRFSWCSRAGVTYLIRVYGWEDTGDFILDVYEDGVACESSDPCGAPRPCPGDYNCDGLINFDDIDPFVVALTTQQCCDGIGANCDVDGNGATDFGDIDPFVVLLSSGASCP